jgi:glycosyltransferase involved in cell wall biosynthesis
MSSVRRRVAVAMNAAFDQGGQGLNFRHVVEALDTNFDVTVFGQGEWRNPLCPVTSIFASRTARLMGRIPLVRRLRDWRTLIEQTHFDRSVAARLTNCDAVVAAAGSALATFQLAKPRGIRCVLDVTTTHVDHFGEVQDRELSGFGGRPVWHPRLRTRTRAEYELADAIRVMSAVAKRTLTDRGVPADKIFVATPPVADPAAPQASFEDPTFRVEFVGLIEPAKGFHYLIEAFDRLDRSDSELTLWGGPGLRKVARYLAERTTRNPRIKVAPQSVRKVGFDKVYARSTVLVLPSLADGFGYVVGEAMSCGLPVIVTTATGAADLVEEGVNGFIVPPADPAALADRLDQLAADRNLSRKMGAAARRTADRYGPEQFRSAWSTALSKLF